MPRRFLSEEKMMNIAHRGFTAAAPENTLLAFQHAIELGADGIELDVRLCKSGEVIVFHDAKLERMTSDAGAVKSKNFDELRELRVLHNGVATPEQIPTLDEVLELVAGKMFVNIEIKVNGLPSAGLLEEKVLAICQHHGVKNDVIISSFNPLTVRKIRKLDDSYLNGYIVDKNIRVGNAELFLSRMAGARAIHIEHTLLTEILAEKIIAAGFVCLVWTVNEIADMQRMLQLGVEGVITDKPDALMKMMNVREKSDHV